LPAAATAVKQRLLEAGLRQKYREFVTAVSRGADSKAIAKMLAGYPELVLMIPADGPKAAESKPLASKGSEKEKPSQQNSKQVGTRPAPEKREASEQQQQQQKQQQQQQKQQQQPEKSRPQTSAPRRPHCEAIDADAKVLAPLRANGLSSAAALVRVILSGRARPSQRLRLLKYLQSLAGKARKQKQLFLLRGPPGVGKSSWALEKLRTVAHFNSEEELAVARLAHVCALSDFFTDFEAEGEERYSFKPEGLELARAKNVARLQLALENNVGPLFVDSCNLRLWELGAYASRAKAAGYDVTLVSPDELFPGWNEIDTIDAKLSSEDASRVLSREQLASMLAAFEDLAGSNDPLQLVLKAKRSTALPVL